MLRVKLIVGRMTTRRVKIISIQLFISSMIFIYGHDAICQTFLLTNHWFALSWNRFRNKFPNLHRWFELNCMNSFHFVSTLSYSKCHIDQFFYDLPSLGEHVDFDPHHDYLKIMLFQKIDFRFNRDSMESVLFSGFLRVNI